MKTSERDLRKTSHKKNRPFDFKLIDLVEPHTILYQRQTGLSNFEMMKAKNLIWKTISEEMGASSDFCIMRWGNLRGQFQKELRYCRELCPKMGVIRGSHWPYLDRMRFLEETVTFNRPKRIRLSRRKQRELARLEQQEANSNNEWNDDFKEENITESDEEEIQSEIDSTSRTFMDNFIDSIGTIIAEDDADVPLHVGHHEEIVETEIEHLIPIEDHTPSTINLQRMGTLLVGIEGENLARVERRIMAFLCKCQLRALCNEGVDNLFV